MQIFVATTQEDGFLFNAKAMDMPKNRQHSEATPIVFGSPYRRVYVAKDGGLFAKWKGKIVPVRLVKGVK